MNSFKSELLGLIAAFGIAAVAVGIPTAFLLDEYPQELAVANIVLGILALLIGLLIVLHRRASGFGAGMLLSGAIFVIVGIFSTLMPHGIAITLVGLTALVAYWLLKRQA